MPTSDAPTSQGADPSKQSLIEEIEAMSLANVLIRGRSELGMTQSQLSEVSGISRSAIKGYETGRNMPGARELKALCAALRISPNRLIFGTETPFSGRPSDAPEARVLRESLAEPESVAVQRGRLIGLSGLLTDDEVSSILNLMQSIALARHGAEIVQQNLGAIGLLVGFSQAQMAETKWAIDSGEPVRVQGVVDAMERMAGAVSRGADDPLQQEPKKVTKKTN